MTLFQAEASRSTALPPIEGCDLSPLSGSPTRVDDEAVDTGNHFPEWAIALCLAATVCLWIYAGALLVNKLFPLGGVQ